MRITIVGAGHVGFSLGVLLARNNQVIIKEIDKSKVDIINQGKAPFFDREIEEYLSSNNVKITATTSSELAFKNSDLCLIAVPTDYSDALGHFDTSKIESVLDEIYSLNQDLKIVIKSTIPVGYTDEICKKYPKLAVIFSPEFLREGHSIEDNLKPDRIVIGFNAESKLLLETADTYEKLMLSLAANQNVLVVKTSPSNAEAIKLFSNAFLAMRVSFFNELDTYSMFKKLDTRAIIKGVCLDKRIGDYYNNPSFGYGGYCLPKDTKQLANQFSDVPQKLISAIVDSNENRKNIILREILKCSDEKNAKTIGIYRLVAKRDSCNFAASPIFFILKGLVSNHKNIIIYEPLVDSELLFGCRNVRYFEDFIKLSDLIIANRVDERIEICRDKVLTRDVLISSH